MPDRHRPDRSRSRSRASTTLTELDVLFARQLSRIDTDDPQTFGGGRYTAPQSGEDFPALTTPPERD